jgi:hypothetical protein
VQKKLSNKFPKAAFSIIELSIVAIIISTLVGLIITANKISSNAKLTAARTLTKSSPVNDIDNLVFWVETTMPKSIADLEADNNKTVSTWYDLSPNRNNAISGVAPTYISEAVNGLPVLRFSGTQYLSFSGTAIANSNYTIFVVEQRRASAGSSGGVNYFLAQRPVDAIANKTPHFGYRNNTTLTFAQWANDYNLIIDGYVSPIPTIHTFRFDSSQGKDYYRNGSNLIDQASGVALQGLGAYANAAIGAYSSDLYIGDIAEIIIFNKSLTDNERKDAEQYLSRKWAITLS